MTKNVVMLYCLKWYLKVKVSLPSYYYRLHSKRGIPVRKLRRLEKSVLKTGKIEADVKFWQRCIDLSLYPKSVKFKPPKNQLYKCVDEVYQYMEKKSLRETRKKLEAVKREESQLKNEILSKLTFMEREKLEQLLGKNLSDHVGKITDNHNQKLLNLWLRQRARSPDCILNLSKRELSVEEKNALYRGLNHHILPKKLNPEDIKVNQEKLYKRVSDLYWRTNKTHLPHYLKEEMSGLTRNFLNSSKSKVTSTENQQLHKTLQNLSKDQSITVTRYDKGNGVCLMEKEDYLKKLDDIVNDRSKFEIVEKGKRKNARDPLLKQQDDVKKLLTKHIEKHVSMEKLKELKPSGTGAGKLYGTCKVHKAGYPVRPIVSMINTPEYDLAKYLDKIIKPYIPSKHSITSNMEFLNQLKEFNHQPDDYCISFDVVSLFTNVPLEYTIEIITEELYKQSALRLNTDKPPITKESFAEVLKAATGGIFSHRGVLFKQCDGVSMGNPLAPTLANFFLGHLERDVLKLDNGLGRTPSSTNPVMYVRYVDDIFCIFRKDVHYQPFLNMLNALHPNLAFTHELGGKTLPFLDTKVTLTGSNMFVSEVYRKKTDSGVILNYSSNAPTIWKKSLITWFLNRAIRVCSSEEHLSDEIKQLRKQFYNNGYPNWFFDKVHEEFLKKKKENDKENKEKEQGGGECEENDRDDQECRESGRECGVNGRNRGECNESEERDRENNENEEMDRECSDNEGNHQEGNVKGQDNSKNKENDQEHNEKENVGPVLQQKIFVKVPYVGRQSIFFGKRIRSLLKDVLDCEVRVVYSTTKIKDYFTIKDKSPKKNLSQVVYQFECPSDSAIQYVGYTNRMLRERVSEHLRPGTAIHDHISVCDPCQKHGVTVENFKILKKCRNKNDTAIHEALLIKKLNPVLNRNLKKPGRSWTLQVFN